jgi:high-affinity Fe2+/Pb2+ permease
MTGLLIGLGVLIFRPHITTLELVIWLTACFVAAGLSAYGAWRESERQARTWREHHIAYHPDRWRI